MNRHTPGPWHEEDSVVYDERGYALAFPSGHAANSSQEMKANAVLIAQTPEMLEILESLARLAADEFADDSPINAADFLSWFTEHRPRIMEVIFKAQGGQ